MNKFALIVAGVIAAILGLWLSMTLRFDFRTLDNVRHQWQDFDNQIVVVNYFAEWCAPCLKEVPELNAFHHFATSNSNVTLFAVNFDNVDDPALRALRDKYDMQFNMVSGLPKNAPFSMPRSLPATFIIGPDGNLIKELKGEQTNEALQALTRQLIDLKGL